MEHGLDRDWKQLLRSVRTIAEAMEQERKRNAAFAAFVTALVHDVVVHGGVLVIGVAIGRYLFG